MGQSKVYSFRNADFRPLLMRGFTLVEVLINALILSFLLLVIYVVLNVGTMNYNTDLGLLDLHQQGRRAMEGMIRELRQSNDNTGEGELSIVSDSMVTFFIPPVNFGPNWVGPIVYYLDTDQNQIIREFPAGTTRIIANDAGSLNFSLEDHAVDIQFNCARTVNQRDLSLSFKGEARLRND